MTYEEVVEALKGINIEFCKSEFVSVLGPSGCGKTTLLNIIVGLVAGLLGIGLTILLNIPANYLIYIVIGISVNASLPAVDGVA